MVANVGRSKKLVKLNLRGTHGAERRFVDDQGEGTRNSRRPASEEGGSSPQSATIKSILEINGKDEIHSLAFLMNGKHVLGGGKEEKIRQWQSEDGVEFGAPINAGGWANSIVVSRDGKWIVGGSGRGHLLMWSAQTHERLGEFEGHTRGVRAVDTSADGTKIASGSDDRTACIWERATGRRLLTLQHDDTVVAVKFSPGGSLLATAVWGQSVRIYRSEDGHFLAEFSVVVGSELNQSLAWDDAERHLYAISWDGRVHFLDVSAPKAVSQWPIRTDGTRKHGCIALSRNRRFIAVSNDSSISFWDTATRSKTGSDINYNDHVSTIVISENYDIAIGHGKTIVIRNLHDILPPHCFQDVGTEESVTSPTQSMWSGLDPSNGRITSLKIAVPNHRISMNKNTGRLKEGTTMSPTQAESPKKTVQDLKNELAELRDQYQAQSHELTFVRGRLQASKISIEEKNRMIGGLTAQMGQLPSVDSLRQCGDQLEKLGDTAMDSQRYSEASALFSAILLLNPVNRVEILVKRSKAQVSMGSWENALRDADEIIKSDPSSHWGYEQRHAALHAGGRYTDAFHAFREMLAKLRESSDEHIRDLSRQYIDVTPVIQQAINDILSDMPNVLIDSTTGCLCNKAQQKAAFQKLSIFDELRSSMTTHLLLSHTRIKREVEEFYRYVMLSHRWEDGEPLYQTVQNVSIYKLELSSPNSKLKEFSRVARALGFHWVWSDTCCIDKKDMVVLHASLVAMFRWYRGSALTIVHLHGVQSSFQKHGDLGRSDWSKRGWTYQEYLAAETVQFYTEDWKPYLGLDMFNHKMSPIVIAEIAQASQVSAEEQRALQPGPNRVREKLFLASQRLTTVAEDAAYSLLGIFDANIFIKYGEGKCKAVGRLLEYVLTSSRDVTILAWNGPAGEYNSCLPADLTVYDRLTPLQIPHAIEPVKMDEITQELHSSLPRADISSIARLFDQLSKLPPPSINSGHLQLSGLAFPITICDELKSENDFRVYRGTTTALGEVEITTKDNLPRMRRPLLFHPWISTLLDQDFSGDDDELGDETNRALRLVARLRQPFGALLLTQASRTQHRRVATDSLILVRIREDVPWAYLTATITTVDLQ